MHRPRHIAMTLLVVLLLATAADAASARDTKVNKQLDETTVSFTFNEQPLDEALGFLQTLGNVNVVVDRRVVGEAPGTVTLRMQNETLRAALEGCFAQVGLDYVVREGVVFVSTGETLKRIERETKDLAEKRAKDEAAGVKLSEPDRRTQKKLDDTIVSFTFNEQPFAEAFDFLQTLGNVNIVIDRRKLEDADATLTLKLNNVTLATAVQLAAEQMGLRPTLRDGVVFLSDPETVRTEPWKTRRVFMRDMPTEAERKALDAYRDVVVSFTFNKQPVVQTFEFLCTLGHANVVLDRRKLEDVAVTLKLNNARFTTALTLVCEQAGLEWVIREDVTGTPVIFITEAADVRKQPRR